MNSNIANAPIGVFDSGVGGLTVLRAVHHQLPSERLLYVADSGHAPYGERNADYITSRCLDIARFLQKQPVKAMVVACNTASVIAIKQLRESCSVPIVGIEPAIKPAAQATRSGVVGVLATSQTTASDGVKKLCELYGKDVEVILKPCPGLVDRIERAELNTAETRQMLITYLSPLLDAGADTIVLGCTHYPFVRDVIQSIVGDSVTVIEPGAAVAKQLSRRLDELQLSSTMNPCNEESRTSFYSTGEVGDVTKIISSLWGRSVFIQSLRTT